ncbi:MAG TPA: hypothetical protein PLK77_13890, partial [Pyrinomonadaceae bacterium]|nr:hypothetical protein [Pyrinomonadaceae bacterium]
WGLAIINFRLGNMENAELLYEELGQAYVAGDAFQLAEVCAVRSEVDKAFEWLDRALEERDPGITHAQVSTHLRPLHNDSRWGVLITKLGL